MNKGNESFQSGNYVTDISSNLPKMEARNNNSFNHRNTQSMSNSNELHLNLKNINKRNVLNEFKATLAETEKFTSLLNSNNNSNMSRSYFIQVQENKMNDNDNSGDCSSISIGMEEDDPLSRLKISNEVLTKTNLDLRNTNKILKDEIEAYKNSSVYKSPYSQYDANLNEFIANIKQALNTSQMSNLELQEIVTQTQKRSESLANANSDIVKHYDTVKGEYEAKTKETSELKVVLGNRDTKIEQLNNTIIDLNNKIASLESRIVDNEKQINFQLTINSSYNKYKADTEDMLNNLKETIENLQKGNVSQIDKGSQLQMQLDDLRSSLMLSESTIEKMNHELRLRDTDISKHIDHIEELNKIIQQLKDGNAIKQNEFRLVNGEKEKLNAQIESLNLFIEDREKTIATLKTSLGILTKTFDNDMNVLKGTSNDSISVQMVLNDKIDKLNDQIQSYEGTIEQMNVENEDLRRDCVSFQKEIDNYSNQFEQSQYEYQLLYQKYKEQAGFIETLKVEFLNKRKDSELMDLIKANEEILKNLKKIQDENKAKTQEINDLKANYSKISRELFEAQRVNTSLETQNNFNPPTINDNKVYNHIFQSEINDLEDSTVTKSIRRLQETNSNNRATIDSCHFYTMSEMNHIISFNIQSKVFKKISYTDKSGSFKKSYDFTSSLKINFAHGLFFISNNLVFYFNPKDNSIKQVSKLSGVHRKTNAIYINNELYIISGENTKKCEKVSFDDWNTSKLPDVNYIRTEGGVCCVDNKYLFVLFGSSANANSIERLNLKYRNGAWEIMKYSTTNRLGFSMLTHFICFSSDQNITIIGGINQKGICNNTIVQYDYNTERINEIPDSGCYSLFNDQISQIDDNLFINFDIEGNLHIFDKIFSFYEVFKLSFNDD